MSNCPICQRYNHNTEPVYCHECEQGIISGTKDFMTTEKPTDLNASLHKEIAKLKLPFGWSTTHTFSDETIALYALIAKKKGRK